VALHPDRLLPADTAVRAVARQILARIADLPIVAVHGHVEAAMLQADEPFPDPATLLVTVDHYVLRALHGAGTPLAALGRGDEPAPPEQVWGRFCEGWPVLRGSATGLWLAQELEEVFGVATPPRPADYATLRARLAEPDFRPRALFQRFGLELLSTTDPVGADFGPHLALQADGYRVVPTLRPDALTDATREGWVPAVSAAGVTSADGLLELLRVERARSAAGGAVATDHGHATPHTEEIGPVAAESLFRRAVRGAADPGDLARLAGHLLLQLGVMAVDDGLVLQLHTGVLRDHDRPGAARYGPDIGADFPVTVGFTTGLRALLERCGNEPGFRMVAFTVDETSWSRELAPMASYWPGLWLGAPWWFLDAPGAMSRHLAAVADSAGYAKLSGFVDDTRAFCSIPARHDVARRVLAAHLAGAVVEHRLSFGDAAEIAETYAYGAPRALYRTDR
jgi:glucuronate isomerase